ncbi:unnamed protein product [Arctogadus glacialis]
MGQACVRVNPPGLMVGMADLFALPACLASLLVLGGLRGYDVTLRYHPLVPQPGRGASTAAGSLLRQTYGETHTTDLLNVCACAYAHAYGIGATVASPTCRPARDRAPGWHGEVASPWTGQLLHCRAVIQHVDGPQSISALPVPIVSAHRRAADYAVVWGHSGKFHFPQHRITSTLW